MKIRLLPTLLVMSVGLSYDVDKFRCSNVDRNNNLAITRYGVKGLSDKTDDLYAGDPDSIKIESALDVNYPVEILIKKRKISYNTTMTVEDAKGRSLSFGDFPLKPRSNSPFFVDSIDLDHDGICDDGFYVGVVTDDTTRVYVIDIRDGLTLLDKFTEPLNH